MPGAWYTCVKGEQRFVAVVVKVAGFKSRLGFRGMLSGRRPSAIKKGSDEACCPQQR
jgi:hypothetical protein